MEAEIHPRPNPYQSPRDGSTAKLDLSDPTGSKGLLFGFVALVICTIVLGYLALAEVPCIRKDFSQKNGDVPQIVTLGENFVIFVCENFLILFPLLAVTLIVIETMTSGNKKRLVRRSLGIIIGTATIILTIIVALGALSAMNWTSLYFS